MPPLTRRTDDPAQVRIYHICAVDNLASIVQCGALYSFNELEPHGIAPVSIAHTHLQQRRHALQIPLGDAGTLHDYVPWSFAARSPMLSAIHNREPHNNVAQDKIVHLVSDISRVQSHNLEFAFTDGHPLTTLLTRYSNDMNQLIPFLDWPVLLDNWWNNTAADRDRSRRRQSEFLIRKSAPWEMVLGIGVRTEMVRLQVEKIVQNCEHQPRIQVLPSWYY